MAQAAPATHPPRRAIKLLHEAGLMTAPYVAGGSSVDRDGGLDCYGFVRAGLVCLGVEPALPERCAELLAVEPSPFRRIDRASILTGDVVTMTSADDAGAAHIALVIDRDVIAHTISATGRPRTDSLSVLERAGFAVTGFYRILRRTPAGGCG